MNIVLAAFATAADTSADYLAGCFRTRSTDRVGSWYEGFTPDTLREALLAAEWSEYPHPELKSPAVGFRAEIGGKLGVVSLDSMPADAEIVLLDPKGGEEFWTGERSVGATVSASRYGVEAPSVGHTTLILGPASRDEGAPLTVWTFHPGDPVAPSALARVSATGEDLHGKIVSVAEAKAMGFALAKLTA